MSTRLGVCGSQDAGITTPQPIAWVTSDQRLWVIQGTQLWSAEADGGLELRVGNVSTDFGSSLVGETAAGEPYFPRTTADMGLALTALQSDGTLRLIRSIAPELATVTDDRGAPLRRLKGATPEGELLVLAPVDDGGVCDLFLDSSDGRHVSFYRAPMSTPGEPCDRPDSTYEWAPNSPFWLLARSPDGGVFVQEIAGRLSRVSDGGLVWIVGVIPRPGFSDGLGIDGGLDVAEGFTFTEGPFDDPLVVRDDGGLLWMENHNQAMRRFDPTHGITTTAILPGFWAFNNLQLEPDGGAWAFIGGSLFPVDPSGALGSPLHFQDDGNNGDFFTTAQGVLEPGLTGAWMTSVVYTSLVHLDAQLRPEQSVFGLSEKIVDGPFADAGYQGPLSPVWRSGGHLVFLDGNTVRELFDGVVTTLAGSIDPGFVDGPGSFARFSSPLGLQVGPGGRLYVADSDNFAIRLIDASNAVTTIGRLPDRPSAVAVAPDGTVWVLVQHAVLRGK